MPKFSFIPGMEVRTIAIIETTDEMMTIIPDMDMVDTKETIAIGAVIGRAAAIIRLPVVASTRIEIGVAVVEREALVNIVVVGTARLNM